MKLNNHLVLSTSPPTLPARKPRLTARALYRRTCRSLTGKEQDSETGLHYYGARYLDSKTGRWLSGDPALGDYVPQAPVNDEARKQNESLPGMGGVFNYANLHVYHYAGNNPVKYTDPDGKFVIPWPLILEWGIPLLFALFVTKKYNDNKENSTQSPPSFNSKTNDEKLDDNISEYHPPPEDLPGIPDTDRARPKTPIQGSDGKLRRRWKDSDGNIYEWDYYHGEVEKYNPRGKHQGAYDPDTGEQTKPPKSGREVEP